MANRSLRSASTLCSTVGYRTKGGCIKEILPFSLKYKNKNKTQNLPESRGNDPVGAKF